MPKEVYKHTIKNCKKKSLIGLLATEGTLKQVSMENFLIEVFV